MLFELEEADESRHHEDLTDIGIDVTHNHFASACSGLFADTEEESSVFLRMSEIREIRRLYGTGHYSDCLRICDSLSVPDDI